MVEIFEESAIVVQNKIPAPPPLPAPATTSYHQNGFLTRSLAAECSRDATIKMWDRLFDEGYRSDVIVKTDGGDSIYAHANVLGMASPALRGILRQVKKKGDNRHRTISILGVPHEAVRVFIRFLYSSCFEKEDMQEYVLHLLLLSHVYVVPRLKQACIQQLEQGYMTIENAVDILQLALLCDAPRLSLICHRMIVKNFKEITETEGWKAMKESHPVLEKQLLESISDEENMQNERIRKSNERKVYLQLYEAMEALVHICRDGCKTIGPHDKDFTEIKDPCNYSSCKGLELLIRHFAGCKLRVPGGCIHCKRMWQLLELHSRICADSDVCKVPLCRNFKEKMMKQGKKDEMRWRILVKKILTTRIGGSPFFSLALTSATC